ncbi:uncharacterized protein RCC_05263 [Ramularia collo-cygni]|uniref:Uncharacterized protein n=1 Tax=Ramularia collo-cygni TaxID=112498 RepID=A0A2D3UQY6_9PEZI|nr:uncharacterized protein RCC_05263 [Ramularia collo-cygni]CZT19412.1 uncharacterized protein RCC_05263 [Ramularia collo-cygni]
MSTYRRLSRSPLPQHDILITSLGPASPDALYFSSAFSTLEGVEALIREDTPQKHLDLGLRAAYASSRADVGKKLLQHGANSKPLVAFIGTAAAQEFFNKPMTASWASEQEKNSLRLQWTSLQPKNKTALVAVEGFDEPAPSILHLQALHTSMSPAQRIAWMQFDLDRAAPSSNINRLADIRNVQGTPLLWAVEEHGSPWENRKVLTFLLENGADPLIKDREGRTPRDYVVEMLAMPEEDLAESMREFYKFALSALEGAEASASENIAKGNGFLGKMKGALGY